MAARFTSEPGITGSESLAACGIILVEGFNDVIGLDNLGVPSSAIMSNMITEQQVTKVERWARSLASNRVTILFDAKWTEGGEERQAELVARIPPDTTAFPVFPSYDLRRQYDVIEAVASHTDAPVPQLAS